MDDYHPGLTLDVKGSDHEYDWDVSYDPLGLAPTNPSSFRPVYYSPPPLDLCTPREIESPRRFEDDDNWWWSTPNTLGSSQGAGEEVRGHQQPVKCQFCGSGFHPLSQEEDDAHQPTCELDHCGDPPPQMNAVGLSLSSLDSNWSDDNAPTEYFSMETIEEKNSEVKGQPIENSMLPLNYAESYWNMTFCSKCQQVESDCCRELKRRLVVEEEVELASSDVSEKLPVSTEVDETNHQSSTLTSDPDNEYKLTKESLQKLNQLLYPHTYSYSEDDQSIATDLDEIMDEIVELVDCGTSVASFASTNQRHRSTSTADLLYHNVKVIKMVDVAVQEKAEVKEVSVQTDELLHMTSPTTRKVPETERNLYKPEEVTPSPPTSPSPSVKGHGQSRIPLRQSADRHPSFILKGPVSFPHAKLGVNSKK